MDRTRRGAGALARYASRALAGCVQPHAWGLGGHGRRPTARCPWRAPVVPSLESARWLSGRPGCLPCLRVVAWRARFPFVPSHQDSGLRETWGLGGIGAGSGGGGRGRTCAGRGGEGAWGEGRIRATRGWISVDRGSKATLPLTMPRRVFKSSAKDSARRPLGRELRGGRPRRVGRAGLASGTGPWGLAPLTWVGAGGGRRRRLLAWILT